MVFKLVLIKFDSFYISNFALFIFQIWRKYPPIIRRSPFFCVLSDESIKFSSLFWNEKMYECMMNQMIVRFIIGWNSQLSADVAPCPLSQPFFVEPLCEYIFWNILEFLFSFFFFVSLQNGKIFWLIFLLKIFYLCFWWVKK